MVAIPRIRLVWGGRGGANLPPFVAASIAGHVLVTLLVLLAPLLFGRKRMMHDPLVVDLVAPAAAPAGPPSPPAAVAPPPPPPTEPPEGVRAAAKEPPPVKRTEPKPEKPPPKKAPPPPPPPAAPPPSAAGPTGPAAAAAAGRPTGDDSGSVTSMEAGDFELAWYRDSVTAALYRQWVKPLLEGVGEPYEVGVTFDILRDGSVADLRIEQPSGVPSLDRSALRAVTDAAPFPPLPPAWLKPRLSARFLFRLYPE